MYRKFCIRAVAMGTLGLLGTLSSPSTHADSLVLKQAPATRIQTRPGTSKRQGEPQYTRAQVSVNDGTDGKRMWVTYKSGVYDISEFRKIHPGGYLIMQAAGTDVMEFWDRWAWHHEAPLVGSYLEKLRIGELVDGVVESTDTAYDPYGSEPVRNKSIHTIFTERPFSSETTPAKLGASYLTSAEALYVRNHAPVPDVAWNEEGMTREEGCEEHELVFETESIDAASTHTITELRDKFGVTTITSILQCAGNRASEDIAATGPSGFSGGPYEKISCGMIGNLQWSGVLLSEILPCFYPEACKDASNWHVVFEGADEYQSSTPLNRLLDRKNDCLIATEMNNEPLSPDHGYPARVVLPGVAGARNVKWLQSIKLSKNPSTMPWNEYYYKNSNLQHIQELPLQALVLGKSYYHRGLGKNKTVVLNGVAYSGGTGNKIARVEVSTDNGKNWQEAQLKTEEVLKDGSRSHFGWVRWTASVVAPTQGSSTVVCRATDSEGITQVEVSPKQKGYLFNGWSKMKI